MVKTLSDQISSIGFVGIFSGNWIVSRNRNTLSNIIA